MTDLIKGLIEYFDTTPKEVLERELAEIEVYNSFGPEVLLFLENTEVKFEGSCHSDVFSNPYFSVNSNYCLAA